MSGQLIPRGGGDAILLPGEDFTIGRDPSCDVVIAARGVSERHCRLGFRKGSWYVKDLGSKNGIRVNGKRCEKSRLPTGSTLALGAARFEIVYGSPGQAPSSPEASPRGDAAETLPVKAASTPKRRIDSVSPPASPAPAQPDTATPAAKPIKRFLGKLTPQGGGDLIPLLSDRLIVGRNRDCDVRLAFSSISSQHCELEFRDGYWFVRDLDSSNGTRVNGQSVTSSIVMPGDILRFAKLRYEIDYKPRADAPPPEENPFEQSLLEKAGLQQRLDRNPDPNWLESDPDQEADKRIDLESL
jgi:pSer/pThr/pTyr-binding forkhead associated (FHA) protein